MKNKDELYAEFLMEVSNVDKSAFDFVLDTNKDQKIKDVLFFYQNEVLPVLKNIGIAPYSVKAFYKK